MKGSLRVRARLLGLIAARDFWAIVETKSFLIGLLAFIFIASVMPIMMVLGRVPSTYKIAVLDPIGGYTEDLRARVRPAQMQFTEFRPPTNVDAPRRTTQQPASTGELPTDLGDTLGEAAKSIPRGGVPEATADELLARVRANEYYALVEIKRGPAGEQTFTMNSVSMADFVPRNMLHNMLNSIILYRRAEAMGITEKQVDALVSPARIETRKITQTSTERADSEKDYAIAFLFPIALVFSLYGLISFQSERLLTALLEEKMKRLIEVLLTRVTIYELLLGKMLGVLYVGFLLYAGVSLLVILGSFVFGVSYLLNVKHFFFFTLFYISGYMLYACFYAAIGAACGNPKDAENLSMPLRMVLMMPIMLSVYVVSHPQTAGSYFFAFFPLTAPFVMINRMIVNDTPWWELMLALGCVGFAAAIGLWASARVFAASMVNPGRSMGLREIWISITGRASV
ncbi:hypothetical protein DB346_10250 [Verrucomicrobia bacterium LW23]|nr:hypothetical protein DB346_10250 [Verrucomicrobia bacterium LW23]